MCKLDTYKIDLKALDEGLTEMSFHADDAYFQALEGAEVSRGDVQINLTIDRQDSFFDLHFAIRGSVIVACDRCLDDMEQPIESEAHLVAKFGEEYSEDDDLVTVAEDEGILDVAWFIYEFIALAIPVRHVHAPGKCNPAMTKLLDEHSAARSGEERGDGDIDPRWEALRKLKQ